MNTDPENPSNEIEASTQSGITRRSFIKRTSATVVVTALALHAFRHEAHAADEGGSSSWKPAIELLNPPASVTITSTPSTNTYNSKVYTMTMVTTISPFPFNQTLVDTPEGKMWKYLYKEVIVTCAIGVTVTSLSGTRLFSDSYNNFFKVLSASIDPMTGVITGAAEHKIAIPDIDFGYDLVLRIGFRCWDGNLGGGDQVNPGVSIFPAFFKKEHDEEGEHAVNGPSSATVEAGFKKFLMKK